ncbi:hypothetical protein BDQ17DRAFT_1257903 [Cyathus striatus]|nr:hypothetical protein BDQ17DRAFT_1257903 [Cyathus striatus]
MNTSEGTRNLHTSEAICSKQLGSTPAVTTEVDTTIPIIPYSEAAHQALIAMHCAKYHRSFNSVLDEEYKAEVNMLHPGTKIPLPITVGRDINAVYLELSKHVRKYFAVCYTFSK